MLATQYPVAAASQDSDDPVSQPDSVWRKEGVDDSIAARGLGLTLPETIPGPRCNTGTTESGSWRSGSMVFEEDRLRVRAKRVLKSGLFDAGIGCVILLNCVSIGVEQSLELKGEHTEFFIVAEQGFIFIYMIEFGLRVFAHGFKTLKDNWVRFDTVLLVIAMLTNWLIQPFFGNVEGLGVLMVLRTARLLRLARAVRLLIKFRELWMLVQGLMNSAYTMLYTLLILGVIIYIFSSVAIELITKNPMSDPSNGNERFATLVETFFPDLPSTMLTLVQFATLDSMNVIYMPLIQEMPILAIYFFSLILIVSIVLMNLITAVVVNSALESALKDKELIAVHEALEKKKMVQELRNLFLRLDHDMSGEITKDEIVNVSPEDRELLKHCIPTEDPLEIFDQLDVDNSGSIGIDEFCDGVWQAISDKGKGNIDRKRTEKKIDMLRQQVDVMRASVDTVTASMSPHLFRENARSRVGGIAPSVQEHPAWVDDLISRVRAELRASMGMLQLPEHVGDQNVENTEEVDKDEGQCGDTVPSSFPKRESVSSAWSERGRHLSPTKSYVQEISSECTKSTSAKEIASPPDPPRRSARGFEHLAVRLLEDISSTLSKIAERTEGLSPPKTSSEPTLRLSRTPKIPRSPRLTSVGSPARVHAAAEQDCLHVPAPNEESAMKLCHKLSSKPRLLSAAISR